MVAFFGLLLRTAQPAPRVPASGGLWPHVLGRISVRNTSQSPTDELEQVANVTRSDEVEEDWVTMNGRRNLKESIYLNGRQRHGGVGWLVAIRWPVEVGGLRWLTSAKVEAVPVRYAVAEVAHQLQVRQLVQAAVGWLCQSIAECQ